MNPRRTLTLLCLGVLLGAAPCAGAPVPNPAEAHLYPRGARVLFLLPLEGRTEVDLPSPLNPATLEVTDIQGATGSTNIIIKAEAAKALARLTIETGEISVGST